MSNKGSEELRVPPNHQREEPHRNTTPERLIPWSLPAADNNQAHLRSRRNEAITIEECSTGRDTIGYRCHDATSLTQCDGDSLLNRHSFTSSAVLSHASQFGMKWLSQPTARRYRVQDRYTGKRCSCPTNYIVWRCIIPLLFCPDRVIFQTIQLQRFPPPSSVTVSRSSRNGRPHETALQVFLARAVP